MDILGSALTLSAPSCPKPTASNTDGGMNWFSCSGDTNSWYGLSNVGMIRDDAIDECAKYGAEVISVFNADIDLCAYYTLSLANLQNEGAWSSAFYGNNKYQWCPNGTDIYRALGVSNYDVFHGGFLEKLDFHIIGVFPDFFFYSKIKLSQKRDFYRSFPSPRLLLQIQLQQLRHEQPRHGRLLNRFPQPRRQHLLRVHLETGIMRCPT